LFGEEGQSMKEAALWLLVVVIAGCSGTKSNSGPPFLDGLAVSKESPIEVECRGDISGGFQFSDKDQFRAAYEGMKDAQANGKVYAPGNGPAYDFRYFQSCEVTQSGRSFESWARR
jgi:hypothetical protein